MGNPRWSAIVSDEVTAHVLRYRNDALVLRRFFAKVDYGFEPLDCEIWTGALSDEGYGDVRIGGRTLRVHRVAWIWHHGLAPAEPTPFLDHAITCIGRFCLNLRHLEPVDEAENQRRRTNVGARIQRELRRTELLARDERRIAGEPDIF